MSVKKYLEENGNKMEDKKIKKGKIKLNKKIVAGIVAVVLVAGTAVGIAGCGKQNVNENNQNPSSQVEQVLEKTQTVYYDTLDENVLYFKANGFGDLEENLNYLGNMYGFKITEEGMNILREEMAKYIYLETTARKVSEKVDYVLKNEVDNKEWANLISPYFLDQYINILKEQNNSNNSYSIDRNKLMEVLKKFVEKEYTLENDLEKLKSVVGDNVQINLLKENNFGYNSNYDEYNNFLQRIVDYVIDNKYRMGYYAIEYGESVIHDDAKGYIASKFGTIDLTLEQMNIKYENIISEDELDELMNYNEYGISYKALLEELYGTYLKKYYTSTECFINGYDYFKKAFTKNGNIFVYKNNSNMQFTEEYFEKISYELAYKLDEAVITSKIKNGEYTIEGNQKIEKPKILQK